MAMSQITGAAENPYIRGAKTLSVNLFGHYIMYERGITSPFLRTQEGAERLPSYYELTTDSCRLETDYSSPVSFFIMAITLPGREKQLMKPEASLWS